MRYFHLAIAIAAVMVWFFIGYSSGKRSADLWYANRHSIGIADVDILEYYSAADSEMVIKISEKDFDRVLEKAREDCKK